MLKKEQTKCLKRWEEKIGKKLKKVPLDEVLSASNSYSGDAEGNITGLNLRSTDIGDISFLSDFPRLTYLYLGVNQITDLSPLQQLINLTDLRLYSNQITELSPLQHLSNLTYLNLGGNQITELSPLQQLSNLTILELGRNQITDLSPLQNLSHLTTLYLENNQITDLSPLQHLSNLTQLDLGHNQITDLTPLQHLSHLTELYLYKNQITDLTPLQHLSNLTELYLYENPITDLSPLQQLSHLTYLDIGSNQITDLSPLLPLKELKSLLSMNNKISRLTGEWANRDMEIKWEFDGSDGLFLRGNPLESPPVEIVRQGDAAVRNYFKEIEKETVLLLRAKVLLVGSGSVGKTTLMKKLQDPLFKVQPGQESTTRGIDIQPWQLTCSFANRESLPVDLHFWDFGGQDILYATHQFFLTKRSLYLFVWEARQEGFETASFDYWLNIIKLLSDASPVIIVMNKADSRCFSIEESSLRQKFPNIRDFIQVSCLTGKGIADLTELIRAALGDMPHLLDPLPKTWLQIRDDLKNLGKNYISRADYLALCETRGLSRDRAEFLGDYLHDLGAILHFRGEPLLAETVILNPEWATAAVYKIIDAPGISTHHGRFKYADLKTYWPPPIFPEDKHLLLVGLMEKFELCFPVLGTRDNTRIVPELLPADPPAGLDRDRYRGPGCLCFQYHYEFMPRGIISRFIARLYTLIAADYPGGNVTKSFSGVQGAVFQKSPLAAGGIKSTVSTRGGTTPYWKSGVELALENTFALVHGDPLNRQLTVSVRGLDKSELLAIARHHLEEIHRSLNMKKDDHYREMIPCRCGSCQTAEKSHLFRHDVLKRYVEKNIPVIRCDESLEEVPLAELLKGVAAPPQEAGLTKLLPALLITAGRLLGRAKAVKPDEDSRNTFIAELLGARGYIVKDQIRWGSSYKGKGPGELDIFIETPGGKAVSVIEAFILKGMHREVIARHFEKLFAYDAPGLDTNFIIVYAENADFAALWREYLNYLPAVKVKYPLLGAPEEEKDKEKNPYADIKLARSLHNRHDRQTTVYHLFLNMPQ